MEYGDGVGDHGQQTQRRRKAPVQRRLKDIFVQAPSNWSGSHLRRSSLGNPSSRVVVVEFGRFFRRWGALVFAVVNKKSPQALSHG
jgi:hypothetical protein